MKLVGDFTVQMKLGDDTLSLDVGETNINITFAAGAKARFEILRRLCGGEPVLDADWLPSVGDLIVRDVMAALGGVKKDDEDVVAAVKRLVGSCSDAPRAPNAESAPAAPTPTGAAVVASAKAAGGRRKKADVTPPQEVAAVPAAQTPEPAVEPVVSAAQDLAAPVEQSASPVASKDRIAMLKDMDQLLLGLSPDAPLLANGRSEDGMFIDSVLNRLRFGYDLCLEQRDAVAQGQSPKDWVPQAGNMGCFFDDADLIAAIEPFTQLLVDYHEAYPDKCLAISTRVYPGRDVLFGTVRAKFMRLAQRASAKKSAAGG